MFDQDLDNYFTAVRRLRETKDWLKEAEKHTPSITISIYGKKAPPFFEGLLTDEFRVHFASCAKTTLQIIENDVVRAKVALAKTLKKVLEHEGKEDA